MDTTLLVWGGIVIVGAMLGLLLRPRTIGIVCVVLFCGAVAGIFIGYAMGKESVGFLFGVAAMAIPVVGALLVFGAAVLRSTLGGK